MRLKFTVDFDDNGEEHPVMQGLDLEIDIKEKADPREGIEAFLSAVRKLAL